MNSIAVIVLVLILIIIGVPGFYLLYNIHQKSLYNKLINREKEKEKRYLFALDNMIEGCQIIGFDWTYLYLNNSAERHLRRPRTELLGKNFLDMWPGIENTNVYLMIKNCLEKRVDQIMEDEFIFADGSINWFQLKIHSAPEGVTILSNDITSNKKLLLDLTKAKEKAEDINKLKSNFYANISHELRTPFVGIIGYAELLCEALDVPEYKQMAEGILDSSKRMKETIFKILSFSELELKDIQLSMKKADIKKIIENVYNEFADAARRKNLSFSKRINFESFVILTDELLLRDILDNLMSNAVIYTDHGSVDISAETQIEGNDILLIIRISDTGIGIPKDMQEVIWEEFRQASEGHTRKYQGTGLGLSISKKICRFTWRRNYS